MEAVNKFVEKYAAQIIVGVVVATQAGVLATCITYMNKLKQSLMTPEEATAQFMSEMGVIVEETKAQRN